jgi:hypothetical protein
VTAGRLSIGQRAALERQPGDDIIARAQLVLAPQGGRLGPAKLLSSSLGDRPHAPSLSTPNAAPSCRLA